MFLKKFLILSVAAIGLNAQAANEGGLFVEPSISYELSDAELKYPSPFNSTEGSLDGFGIGARVGFHIYESVFIAADGKYTFAKLKDSENDYNADAEYFSLAPVVGFQVPNVGLRVWGGYVLASQVDPDRDQGLDLKFKEGTGFKVGAGFRIKSVSINLDYQDLTYDKTKIESLGSFNTNTNSDDIELNNKSYIVSLSFPIEL